MLNACPNCGHTTARVYSLDLTRTTFDLAIREWDGYSEFLDDFYITEALCDNCETDLTRALPGPHLRDETTVKELMRLASLVVDQYDYDFDVQEVGGQPFDQAIAKLRVFIEIRKEPTP